MKTRFVEVATSTNLYFIRGTFILLRRDAWDTTFSIIRKINLIQESFTNANKIKKNKRHALTQRISQI